MSHQLLPRALVSMTWLSEALKTCKPGAALRVLDASFYYPPIRDGRKEYAEKHIPGALYYDIDECKDLTSPYEVMLPSESHFSKYVGNLGINNDTHVVIYDADQVGVYYAARAWWMFRVFGHKKVSVLNGGFRNWVKQGLPVTAEVEKPKPESFRAVLNPSLVKSYEDIQKNRNTKEFQLVDSRSEGRYLGTEPEPGEVIKFNPFLLPPRSAPPHTVHHHRKLPMSSANSYRANQQKRTPTSQNGSIHRSNSPPAHIKNDEELTRDLVPANIRHKYGSRVVDQLISPEQVRSSLSNARTRYFQDYYIPRLKMESCFMEDCPHKIYYELGHCLRSNLFPGAPIYQSSSVQDSYTAEVNEKGRLEKHNNHHWHGRKTDHLADQ